MHINLNRFLKVIFIFLVNIEYKLSSKDRSKRLSSFQSILQSFELIVINYKYHKSPITIMRNL